MRTPPGTRPGSKAGSAPPAVLDGYARRVTERPEGEQNWSPFSALSGFTGHVRGGIGVTRHQLELLRPARARPHLLDDDTVARIIRVHRDQAGDLDLFQNQADKWKADPALTGGQRAGVTAYETPITQLRQPNAELLAPPDELSHATINTVLAKSALALAIQALL